MVFFEFCASQRPQAEARAGGSCVLPLTGGLRCRRARFGVNVRKSTRPLMCCIFEWKTTPLLLVLGSILELFLKPSWSPTVNLESWS
jgi:hypothetical protein